MVRILVSGNGQLGKALALQAPWATVLSRAELDITDKAAVSQRMQAERPEVVVNAAAFTQVDSAEEHPHEAFRINVEGAQNVAEAAEAAGAFLVQVSTDYVYPGDKEGPYSESDPTGPLSVYGKTKLQGEEAARACSRLLVVRTSWVFGDGRNFIRSILSAARSGLAELSVVGDQMGLPTYAPHLARAILELAAKRPTGVFHLAGSGPPVSWAGLAEHSIREAGLGARVKKITSAEYSATRSGPLAPRPANSVLDCTKAAALGVSLPGWREAVSKYVRGLAAPGVR